MNKINLKFVELLFGIFVIILIFFMFNLNCNCLSIREISIIFSLIASFELVMGILIWYVKNKTFNHPFLYFVLTCYICWFGQMIFRSFGLSSVNEVIIDSFDVIEFFTTAKYAVVGFGCFILGGVLFCKKHEFNLRENQYFADKKLYTVVTIIALCMIIFSIGFHYQTLISAAISSIKNGYLSIFANEQTGISKSLSNIIDNFSLFFWPGMFLLLVTNHKNFKVFGIFAFFAFLDVILLFIIGTRSDALALILTCLWLYTTIYKKVDFKFLIILLLLGIILFRFIGVIAVFRIIEDRSLNNFISLFFNLESNQVFEVLREFGFNIFSLHYTIKLIPHVKFYSLGYTYFASIMAIIPSLFMGGFSFSDAAALPEWLMHTLNMDYGPGYSILAESYYNFGFFGIFAMLFLGYLLFKVLFNDKKGDWGIINTAFIATFLYTNLFIARDTSLFIFRKLFYLIIIPTFIIKLLYKYSETKILSTFFKFINKFIHKLENSVFVNTNKKILIIDDNKKAMKIKKNLEIKGYNVILYKNYNENGITKIFKRIELYKFIKKQKINIIVCFFGDLGYSLCNKSNFINARKILLVNTDIKSKNRKLISENFDLILKKKSNKNISEQIYKCFSLGCEVNGKTNNG